MSEEIQGFDLRTHVIGKDGRLMKHQPYRIVMDQNGKHYIRDGIRYHEDGTRMDAAQLAPEKLGEVISPPVAPEPKVHKGEDEGPKEPVQVSKSPRAEAAQPAKGVAHGHKIS